MYDRGSPVPPCTTSPRHLDSGVDRRRGMGTLADPLRTRYHDLEEESGTSLQLVLPGHFQACWAGLAGSLLPVRDTQHPGSVSFNPPTGQAHPKSDVHPGS